jgi:hypothetical protein
MLWIVLALVVLETWLARKFSYATATAQKSWAARLRGVVHQLRSPDRDTDSPRSAA